jgi:cytochrome P450
MFWFYNPLSAFLLKHFGPKSTKGQSNFLHWLINIVSSRLAEEDAGNPKNRALDMLDTFSSMKDPDGSPVQIPGVLVEGGNLIGAGADTTAAGISVVLGQLLRHPHDYLRVQREVDDAFAKNSISKASELTYLLAEKIPYLNACIGEATRLNPSILWQLPREAPVDGVTIAGHYVPPGSVISMSALAQDHCKEIYGEDADEWRPERWLASEKGSTPQQVRDMDKYNVTVSRFPTLSPGPTGDSLLRCTSLASAQGPASDEIWLS